MAALPGSTGTDAAVSRRAQAAVREERNCESDTATKKGDPAGTVYATITWGFTVDDKLKVHPPPIVEFNKPTKDMIAAVKQWNTQAGLADDADKSSPTQQLLPELR